jgi:hypothetical protein
MKLLESDWKQKMIYTGTVIHIEEAADSFNKKAGGGGKAWCHYLKILVGIFPDAEPIDAQIVTDQPTLTTFGVDDDIKFYWTAFAKDRYTIQFSQMSKTAESKKRGVVSEEWKAIEKDDQPQEPHYIPIERNRDGTTMIVTGTIIDRSLNVAAHYFQYKEVSDDRFFEFTDKIKAYYKNNSL